MLYAVHFATNVREHYPAFSLVEHGTLRVQFFRLVKERDLDLRFGAATVVTSGFFMAPLTALRCGFGTRILSC